MFRRIAMRFYFNRLFTSVAYKFVPAFIVPSSCLFALNYLICMQNALLLPTFFRSTITNHPNTCNNQQSIRVIILKFVDVVEHVEISLGVERRIRRHSTPAAIEPHRACVKQLRSLRPDQLVPGGRFVVTRPRSWWRGTHGPQEVPTLPCAARRKGLRKGLHVSTPRQYAGRCI